MKLLNYNIVLLVFVAVTILGCKETDHPLTEKGKLLTAPGWHISSDIENGIQHNLDAPWSLDDCWFFYANGTFLNSVGKVLSPTTGGLHEKDSYGTWELVENETKLSYSNNNPYYQLTDSIEIKPDTMILIIHFETVNRLLIYTHCN